MLNRNSLFIFIIIFSILFENYILILFIMSSFLN